MLGAIKAIFLTQVDEWLHIRHKPRVIQLPVTSRCNSRCVTCNVWKEKKKVDINPGHLIQVFSQPFFNKVNSVGINGGEITLIPNFDKIVDAVLTLPSLEWVYIISNGLLPDRLLETLHMVKQKADSRSVKVSLQLSVDGIGVIHENTRGIPGCFTRTLRILEAMKEAHSEYCHTFSVGCTISRSNAAYLTQTETFLSHYPFYVDYHLAVPNRRIGTFDDSDYYVFNDKRSKLLAQEFFHKRYVQISGYKNLMKKFKAFSTYYFLKNGGKGRLSQCQYRYRDITIDESLNAYLCATASERIGSLKETDAKHIFQSKECNAALVNIKKNCDSCAHYTGMPTLKGICVFGLELLKRHLVIRKFKCSI